MRNDKSCTENQNTLFCSITFPRKSYRLCENVEKYGRAGHAAVHNWRMRIACWITNATEKHSEYTACFIMNVPILKPYISASTNPK